MTKKLANQRKNRQRLGEAIARLLNKADARTPPGLTPTERKRLVRMVKDVRVLDEKIGDL